MVSARTRQIILSVIVVAAAFIAPSALYAKETLKIGGAGSTLGTMRLLANAFEKRNPRITVEVFPSLGSYGGIKAVVKGALDIGLSGRPLTDKERREDIVIIEYARSPFVLVVNKDTTASNVSTQDIIEIYSGKRTEWPDGTRVRPVLRPETESDWLVLMELSPEMAQAMKTGLAKEGMLIAVTNQETMDMIAKVPGALGVSTVAQILSEKRSVKMLSLNGVAPNARNVSNGTYPLFKSSFMVISKKSTPRVRQFLEFVGSPAGRGILEKTGNLPVERSKSSYR